MRAHAHAGRNAAQSMTTGWGAIAVCYRGLTLGYATEPSPVITDPSTVLRCPNCGPSRIVFHQVSKSVSKSNFNVFTICGNTHCLQTQSLFMVDLPLFCAHKQIILKSGENYDQSPLLYILHVNFNFEDNHLPFIPSTFLYPDMFDLSPMHRT